MPQPCSETFLPKPVRCWREDTSKNCMYKVICAQVTGHERPVIQVDVLALLLTCETQRTIPLHVKVCNENHMNWKTDWILWMCVPGKKKSKASLVYLSQQLMANIENKTVSLLVLVIAGCHARFWLQFYQVYPTITFNDSFKQPRLLHQSPRLVWSSRKTNPVIWGYHTESPMLCVVACWLLKIFLSTTYPLSLSLSLEPSEDRDRGEKIFPVKISQQISSICISGPSTRSWATYQPVATPLKKIILRHPAAIKC